MHQAILVDYVVVTDYAFLYLHVTKSSTLSFFF